MIRWSVTLRRAPALGLLLMCAVWVACSGTSGDESRAGGAGELRPVELAGLADFPASVRQQLQASRQRVEALGDPASADASLLAEAYGDLGQQLLAYELGHLAEPALLNASDLRPDDYRWHYYLGHLYSDAGQLEKAAREFERAVDARADYAPARIYLARTYRDLGRQAEARELLEELLDEGREPAVAHLLLGHIVAEEDPEAAIEHYERVLELQPGASIVRHPLARAYRAIGSPERSRELLAERGRTKVRFADPLIQQMQETRTGAGARIYAGNRLLEQRRYEGAAEQFELAAAEDSTRVSAFLNLAVAVAQAGEFERAAEALEQVLTLDPSNSRAHYNLGLLAVLSRDPDGEERARRHFRSAIAADSTMVQARLALANLFWRSRDCRSAIPHYEHYLRARARDLVPRMKQAICHAQVGDHGGALELLENGLLAYPGHPLIQGAMIRVLAASPDPAVRDGTRAVRLAEELASAQRSPESLEGLAMAYAEAGRYEEAVQAQRRLLQAIQGRDVAPELLEYLEANLRSYEQGRPCRTPWPPTVFNQ